MGQAEVKAEGTAQGTALVRAEGMAQGYIITILYLFFNYINNGENRKIFKNISEDQTKGIRNCLKKWELLVPENSVQYLNQTQILRYEILYWTIKEMYFSPYKMLLNSLKKEEINNKFLKTEKYCGEPSEENIVKFINYFIVCLREKIDK